MCCIEKIIVGVEGENDDCVLLTRVCGLET